MKIKALAVAATMLLLAGTAHAGVRQFQDGFEGSPATKWRAIGHAGFDINTGNARTGQNNAWLHVNTDTGNSFVDIEVPTGTNGPSTCALQIYAHALNDRSTEIDQVSIYDTEGGGYGLYHMTLHYGRGYEPITIDGIKLNGYKTLKIGFLLQDNRRGFDGEWVRLDDFAVSCAY